MDSTVAVAVLGLIGTLGGSALAYAGTKQKYKGEIDRLERERLHQREHSFEVARFGYRKLYEKLTGHFSEAVRAGGVIDALYDDYNEVGGVGFKPVCDALDDYWPQNRREARELPLPEKLGPLRDAIHRHNTIKLTDLDEMEKRGEA